MTKRVIWCTVGILFGIIVIVGGISKSGSSVSRVECGGKVMYPGDTCETTSKYGVKKVSTYEEQAKSGKGMIYVAMGVGGLIIIVSAWQLVKGLRNRVKPATDGPAELTQHWNQQPTPPVDWQAQQQPPHPSQQPWQYQQQPVPQQQPPNQSWS